MLFYIVFLVALSSVSMALVALMLRDPRRGEPPERIPRASEDSPPADHSRSETPPAA